MSDQEFSQCPSRPEECIVILTELQLGMKRLLGNGNEGIIEVHEKRIQSLEKAYWRLVGGATVVGIVAGLLGFFIEKIMRL